MHESLLLLRENKMLFSNPLEHFLRVRTGFGLERDDKNGKIR